MKILLHLALLMLLASINAYSIDERTIGGIKIRLNADDDSSDEYFEKDRYIITSNMDDEDESDETIEQIDINHELMPFVVVVDTKDPSNSKNKVRDNNKDKNKQAVDNQGRKSKKSSKTIEASNDTIHVQGNIVLVEHQSSNVNKVQYKIDSTLTKNYVHNFPAEKQNLFSENHIARNSTIILYVSTTKTQIRKLASSKHAIKIRRNNFPHPFHIHVKLPNKTHDNIALYFFAYVKNLDRNLDTFIPAGTSQINLQGTNRLSQRLDVYIKANGTELTGEFRGRFGQQFISSNTKLQVFIIPEQSLPYRQSRIFESVTELTIENVPLGDTVTFSLLVMNHILDPTNKYYAIGFISENGVHRLINQDPILIFNKEKFITSKIIFNVIPSSLILPINVIRLMPGSSILQPRSSLILSLHEIDSNSNVIDFKFHDVSQLPYYFSINLSQRSEFNPSKNYNISLMIMDEKNSTYLASSKPIPLLENNLQITIPVVDLLYYVKVLIDPFNNTQSNFIMPGSTARIFVTENYDMLIKPIVAIRITAISEYSHEFSFTIPATSIQRDRDYYLVMIIDMNGIITHVIKPLLIAKNQPPPSVIKLSLPSPNVINGTIYDIDNRPAQWSSSSYATLILVDDTVSNLARATVQMWKIRLEKDFPIRFQIELDFNRLQSTHIYRLQASIDNERNFVEYESVSRILAVNPYGGINTDLHIPVRMVKRFQRVEAIIYMNSLDGPLPESSEIILQISSSPSLTHPNIISKISRSIDGHYLPLNFTLEIPLDIIDINSVHYLFVQYAVHGAVVIPASQPFPFLPRNEKPVVAIISNTAQVTISGQIMSTNGSFMLPPGSLLHLYITKNSNQNQPQIHRDVFLRASPNHHYDFRMHIDYDLVQNKIPLYLHADILYANKVILSMPKPLLLQITSDSEWDINLIVDLPTLLIGQILPNNEQETIYGDFYGHILIIDRNTKNIVHTVQLPVGSNLPLNFRIELNNDLFVHSSALQARAFIKNYKGEIIFDAANTIDIKQGINVDVKLPVVLFDPQKLNAPKALLSGNASSRSGVWRLSVTGVSTDGKTNAGSVMRKIYAGQ